MVYVDKISRKSNNVLTTRHTVWLLDIISRHQPTVWVPRWTVKIGWSKSASDKNFEILLKNYFLLKNFHNHGLCWNCTPPIAWHASNRRIIFWNTHLQVFSSMLCICARFWFSIRLLWLAYWDTYYFSSMHTKRSQAESDRDFSLATCPSIWSDLQKIQLGHLSFF